ncbi:MAG: archaellin/type IV pilin N-terminal domain-containing protein [Candidatus Nanohaloarchaea archaeon]|nr:archaellin/type IV pilin N-terminal domain-containing protein [Candidatus Nanohaloarchaea archaeon]
MAGSSTRKGVSPLIAAVLLIAFTMAVAAIVTSWVTTFTQERTEQLGNRSEEMIQCSYAGINIYEATFDSQNNVTDVSIENTGTVDLANVSATAFAGSELLGTTYISDLRAGETDTSTIDGTNQKPDTIRATTKNCPSVSSEETYIQTG